MSRESEIFAQSSAFVKPDNDVLIVKLFGTWKMGSQVPGFNRLTKELEKTHL